MNKLNVAVVMGGFSPEREISLKSGNVVLKHLDSNKYEVYGIDIDKENWYCIDANGYKHLVNRHDFSIEINSQKIRFDVVFNAIHGSPGEDGLLQAYFRLLQIPQTSCDFYQAALTYNKRDLLSVLKAYGIKTAESYYLNKGDTIDTSAIVSKVGLPCFVKANRSGSSFGVYKVKSLEELIPAISDALQVDTGILIESFLAGREVSVGVINYKGETVVLPITEIITENEFFDYEAKYLGQSNEVTPADIPDDWAQKVSAVAKKVYQVLQMKGFSRSEYIFVNGEPHLLEVNTVPGLTEQSLLPQQAEKAGISLKELFDNAIREVLSSKG
ncbi:MAG: D-alanine--D-alanine ligase [Flavobacteriales bacterium CG_4_9_14_3_um_filter_40_17]|nr:MAG: D-alanine--D-alanine ligase [Flavobacteriales bacterium CG_4_9_14_3_um_filter_40_17]